MASLRSNTVVVIVAAAAAAMLFTVSGALCPTNADELVFPYWSNCWEPALYYGHEVYELAAAPGRNVSGSLVPEYDETNATYYMRLAEVGAKYKLSHLITREYRFYVTQSQNLVFVNVDTGRILGWRQEGEDEYFLVETNSFDEIAQFQFAGGAGVHLICPLSMSARCEAYYILTSNSFLGLSPYEEDGATYFTKGTDTGLPFLLLRTSYSQSDESATKSKLGAVRLA